MQRLAKFDVTSRYASDGAKLAAQIGFGLACSGTFLVARAVIDGYTPGAGPFALIFPKKNNWNSYADLARALAAEGLKRYGFDEASNRLVGNVFEAAQRFPDFRLPELFCGFDRADATTPVPYPVACSPQAWAAGSVFLFLQTMLGLRPHAAGHELELDRPELPEWLTKVTVTNLRVGDDTVDLLFHRWRGGTSAEVIRKSHDLSVTIRM